jgi:phosphatidylglycerophosphate synthase
MTHHLAKKINMKKFTYSHKKACKPFDVEEILDLYINRRVAAPIVKLILNSSLTPNQVTIFSLFVGLAGAVLLTIDTITPLISGGLIYFALVLDCVDGQLARSRDQASLSGRILDGLVDYINTTSFFVAMLIFSLNNTQWSPVTIWIIVGAAGLSDLVHSVLYDYYKNMYITYTIKGYKETIDSLKDIDQELQDSMVKKVWSTIITLQIYKAYLKLQNVFVSSANNKEPSSNKGDNFDEEYAILYRKVHRKLIRIWSAIGMSAHIFPIAISAFVAAFDPNGFIYCCFFFVAIMNPYMVVILVIQLKRSKLTERNNSA